MRRKLGIAGLLLLCIALALPWLRSEEHADLDAKARAQAPGQFIALRHGQVHYRVSGPAAGTPVVLVHGFSVPGYIFDGTRESLARNGFRVVSLDLYGRGWSDRPDVVYDRDLFADQVGELMSALHIPKADLVGLSMGGAVVGRFAARHPERVRKVVLIDPLTRGNDISALGWPIVGKWLFGTWFLPNLRDSQLEDFSHPEQFPDWPQRFLPQMQYRGFGQALWSTLHHLIRHSSVPDFATVGRQHTPVMLVWGRQDETIPFEQSADVMGAIPQARLLAIDHAGHLPHMEQASTVNPAIAAFLQAPLAPQ